MSEIDDFLNGGSEIDAFLGADAQKKPKEDTGDFARGLGNYLPQTRDLGGALTTVAGVATERAFGDNSISRGLIDNGREWSAAAKEDIASKPTDDFTEALDKGIGTVVTDWFPYQAGQAV